MRRLAGTVAATILAAATVGLGGISPAQASGSFCSGTGVNVAVDFHQLGGGLVKACDASGAGKKASKIFPAAHIKLSYLPSQPGYVCKVKGKPADGVCQGTTSYWGLYWAKKGATSWTYSSLGVASLELPAGASVAFSWQGSSKQTPPRVKPPKPPASPKPSPKPKPKPSPKPTPQPTEHPQPSTSPHVSSSASPAASASASHKPGRATHPRRSPSARASASSSATPLAGTAAGPTSGTPVKRSSHGGGGPPTTLWVSLGLIVAMTGATSLVVVHNRR